MIKYSIPGFYELANFNLQFLDTFNNRRECFYDNIEIEAIYGNPQFCIWDGGRVFNNYQQASGEDVQKLINTFYQTFNIPIRYVFTNSQLKEEHFNDRFCNILMNIAHTGNNQVVCADDRLMKYLKKSYPNFKYISSTTKCLIDKDLVKKELNSDYDLVCLDYNLNHNFDFLKTFTPEEKEKTEFLINPICAPACTYRKEHYKLNSLKHLNYGKNYAMKYCHIKALPFQPTNTNAHGNNITYEEIVNIYEPMGFTHFKIEGRTWSSELLALTYVNYMVKPKYKDFILACLLEKN